MKIPVRPWRAQVALGRRGCRDTAVYPIMIAHVTEPRVARPVLSRIKAWRERRILQNEAIDPGPWEAGLRALPMLGRLDDDELARLRRLTTLFLHHKRFIGARGLDVDPTMRLDIALQACLPILNLGLEWYDQWVSIIVYPEDFLPEHEYVDEAGVVHTERSPHSGEAWERGPVLLSWEEVNHSEGLAIHEFAHTLDMRNGQPNGMPPLHRDMSAQTWSQVMNAAFESLNRALDRDEPPPLDPYAATDPGEFFAVTSEYFFAEAQALQQAFPAVYDQLRHFYRQDPLRPTSRPAR
jgi:MtfA peptidase